MLKFRIKQLMAIVKRHASLVDHNATLLQIYKGNLSEFILAALAKQLSGQALEIAKQRISPINVLRRIIDKQSKIYASGVSRQVVGGTDADMNILSYLSDTMRPNEYFALLNAYFNLFKNGLIQPYLKRDGTPGIRVIPSDRFIPFSDDMIDPNTPTGFIIIMGTFSDRQGQYTLYLAIDSESFVYFTSREKDVTAEMDSEAGDGINPIGVVPYVYVNRDREDIVPTPDSDILAMTLLIPVLLTDINYAHMFQSFSIIYGINLTDKGIKWGPNAFWTFESPPGDDRQPQLGTLQPSADINAGLSLVANQFALWLNTKGIKPGAIGEVNGGNFMSGISKIMDEMDTSEDRNEQIPFFMTAESQFWDLTLKRMLPFWQSRPEYQGIRANFTATARVSTNFAEQVPMIRRGAVLDEVIKEMGAKLTTRQRALKRLNPQMTEKEIMDLEKEIASENESEKETTFNDRTAAKPEPKSAPGSVDDDSEDEPADDDVEE